MAKTEERTCHSGSYGSISLEIFAGKKTSLIAAGSKTVQGVHSLGQYAHFDYSIGSMQEKQLLLAF